MSTLAEFVAARLDDRWHEANRHIGAAEMSAPDDRDLIALIALKEAYRALRVVEAQRRTLARHTNCGSGVGYCDDGGHAWDFPDPPGCADLADLAAPDHEHPDFNPAWKADS
jgi:hypothetical protein